MFPYVGVALLVVMATPPDNEAAARAAGLDVAGGGGLNVEALGACPDAATVHGIITSLVSAEEAKDTTLSIQDLGAHYRIALRGEATTLDDPARDCAARARQAAVVVASALRSHPLVLGPPQWTIEKGLVFDVAPGAAGGTAWAPGAEMRGAFGSKRWSIVAAGGARGPVTLMFEHGWKADLLRFPLDAGARLTMYSWKLRPWIVVGPSVTVMGIVGQNLVETDRVWRFDIGALGMVGATLPLFGRVGGAVAINVRWQPRPYQLNVSPVGKVGETPVWWFGLSLNYTLDGKASSP